MRYHISIWLTLYLSCGSTSSVCLFIRQTVHLSTSLYTHLSSLRSVHACNELYACQPYIHLTASPTNGSSVSPLPPTQHYGGLSVGSVGVNLCNQGVLSQAMLPSHSKHIWSYVTNRVYYIWGLFAFSDFFLDTWIWLRYLTVKILMFATFHAWDISCLRYLSCGMIHVGIFQVRDISYLRYFMIGILHARLFHVFFWVIHVWVTSCLKTFVYGIPHVWDISS